MTEKYIARMKRIQANRRRWATKESEGFFNKINRLVEKAEQEMIDEKEKFAKLTDPENTDNVSQILAELDDLSLRKTLENAGKKSHHGVHLLFSVIRVSSSKGNVKELTIGSAGPIHRALIGKLSCVIRKLKNRSVCMQSAFLLFCCCDEKSMHSNLSPP